MNFLSLSSDPGSMLEGTCIYYIYFIYFSEILYIKCYSDKRMIKCISKFSEAILFFSKESFQQITCVKKYTGDVELHVGLQPRS